MLFYFLYDILSKIDGFSALRVFRYPSTRIIAAAITSLIISFIFGPWFIRKIKNCGIGQQINPYTLKSHQSKSGTPTMGGAIILLSLIASTLLWCDLNNPLVWLVILVTMAFGCIGFVDDYRTIRHQNSKGLSGKLRLFIQFTITGCVFSYLYLSDVLDPSIRLALQIPFLDFYENPITIPAWLYIIFSSFVVVGTANAVNLTDGLDGLAIGPTTINASVFLVFAYIAGVQTSIVTMMADGGIQSQTIAEYLRIAHIDGAHELAIYASAMFGAGIGFLWYNTYPASVFMGDLGSLSLGSGIGMLAVLTKNEITLLICGGIFVLEALSCIIQVGSYKLRRKRVFRMAPIHHHFELSGWEEPKIIVRFWLITALLSLVALATIKFR